jgi:4-hydroxy-tetrahydrodipicolinate synthase
MITPFKTGGEIDFRMLDALTEFYLENGANGLFANCLSSEMYDLTPDERLAITRSVVNRVEGKIPVVSSGTFGGAIKIQAEFIRKIHDLGVSAVIIISSQLARENANELKFRDNLVNLMKLVRDIPLGLYECPLPYKRLVSPELTAELAWTGQFLYFKDTSCNTDIIKKKINSIAGTRLSLFNANTPTALETLRGGADGISPISANFYPEFYSWLYRNYGNPGRFEKVEKLNDQLILMDAITRINYPMSAKVFLAKRGLKIEPVIRTAGRAMNFEETRILDKLYDNYLGIFNNLFKAGG